MKIAVVGSGSKCWSLLKNELYEFNIIEIKGKSIKDLKLNKKIETVIYLADPPSNIVNTHLYDTLMKLKPNKFILISSLVVELPDRYNFYRYVKRKKLIENELFKLGKIFKNTKIISLRCSSIIPDKDISKNIYPIFIELSYLSGFIKKYLVSDTKSKELNLYKINNGIGSNVFFEILDRLSLVYVFRPFDILYKFFGKKNYGYTYHLTRHIKKTKFISEKVL